MKFKNILLTLIIVLSCNSLSAQNTTMAKAYLKKANDALYLENYEEAITLIEKCKEELNGSTNPEIIYLEVKTRFHRDGNITLTKELIKQFMNEAFETDARISELAELLIDIESSDAFYANGFRKEYTRYQDDGTEHKYFYDENGKTSKVKVYEGYTHLRTAYLLPSGYLTSIEYYEYGEITSLKTYTLGKLSEKVDYTDYGEIKSKTYYFDNYSQTTEYRLNDRDNDNARNVILESDYMKQTIQYDLRDDNYYLITKDYLSFVFYTEGNVDFLDYHTWILSENDLTFHDNGFVKTIIYAPVTYNAKKAKEKLHVNFDELGIPLSQKMYNHKGLLTWTSDYDSITGTWDMEFTENF